RGRVDHVGRLPALRGKAIQVGLGAPRLQDVFLVGRLPRLLPEFRFTHRRTVESRGAHKRIVPREVRTRFTHPGGGFKPRIDIPLLRGINDGNRLRREGPGCRWSAVLLLLALRAHERSFAAPPLPPRARGPAAGHSPTPPPN